MCRIVVNCCLNCKLLHSFNGKKLQHTCKHPKADYDKHPYLLNMKGKNLDSIPTVCPLKDDFVDIVLAPIWERKEDTL